MIRKNQLCLVKSMAVKHILITLSSIISLVCAANPNLYDAKHGIKMGVPSDGCDDAKTNLEMDWDGNSVNFTCFNPTRPLVPNTNVPSSLHCDSVSNDYFPSEFHL